MSDTIIEKEEENHPFREYEEEAVVSLMLDSPEFFGSVSKYVRADLFTADAAVVVVGTIKEIYEKYQTYTRGIIRDAVYRSLRGDSDYEPVNKLLKRRSNPQEAPYVKNLVTKWAKHQAYGILLSGGSEIFLSEEKKPFDQRNYAELDKLFDAAQRITEIAYNGLWYFDNIDLIFRRDAIDHFTTGFVPLDKLMHNNGPGRGEVVCWLGATNAGKSILLVNNALYNMKAGRNVLHITLEMSDVSTHQRITGAYTNIALGELWNHEALIRKQLAELRSSVKGNIYIQKFPGREITVNEISTLIRHLENTKGWKPDVVIVDYMELMMARRDAHNDDDYVRQKTVAAELRGLAVKENIIIFTATQANRAGAQAAGAREKLGIDKVADSWAKTFDIDYFVSIVPGNPINEDDEDIVDCELQVTKNRFGPTRNIQIIMNRKSMHLVPKINSSAGITL